MMKLLEMARKAVLAPSGYDPDVDDAIAEKKIKELEETGAHNLSKITKQIDSISTLVRKRRATDKQCE